MPRYVLEIANKSIAVFDAPNPVRAAALVWSSELAAVLTDTTNCGIALWDGLTWLSYRPASPEEEQQWQAEHWKRNTEFGIDDDQGLTVWSIPIDSGSPSTTFRDDWRMW